MTPATAPLAQPLGFSLGQPAQPGSEIRTIDQERLFFNSRFGQRVRDQIIEASRALEAENQRLLDDLSEREAELTALRPTLSPEAFRTQADAFNEEVGVIRDQQERKSRQIGQFQEAEQGRFYDLVVPLLDTLLQDVGARVLLDTRVVLLSDEDVDLTDQAIERIDATLGDGADGVIATLPDLGAPDDESTPPAPRAPEGSAPLELPSPGLE
ncbi:OmpH family outer membrane protein [Rhodobacteraceae bacterium 2376]|uniref:OmpH family outer membrane protein n=2 Tax=Rhabdonatronobacter sediminivivens TaxID=2743469 RepID=A0A7Z0KXK9_9RHOB|nr:OmpH family outer membrane protein [Rhabdonatronobacter sediminivivens]